MTNRANEQDPLAAAREAAARNAWEEAYDLLYRADGDEHLGPAELGLLALAASWTGRLDESVVARERAYLVYLEQGNERKAGQSALELAVDLSVSGKGAIAEAWAKRGARLLEGDADCLEYAALAFRQFSQTWRAGLLEEALAHAEQALELGTRFGDRDVQARALQAKGRILIDQGRVADGMAFVDEATVAAVAGELSPMMTGIVYCRTITICRELTDYRRAADWTEAAKRWCERQSIHGFPGLCRVHRAELLRLKGAYAEAEREAIDASVELERYFPQAVGEAVYEVGEVRFRMGDFAGAEAAFRQAHSLGFEPQPGFALLRLAQGNTAAAASGIASALANNPLNRLARAGLLPAQVEIAVALGKLDEARAAVEELSDTAETFGTPVLAARAAEARASLQLANEDMDGVVESARQARRLWQEVDAPYECARVRIILAEASNGLGDADAARLELEAAHETFDRLGAAFDAARAASLLERQGRSAGERVTRTFMFTDICDSTRLVEAIGDEAWEGLIRWHDRRLRGLFAEHGGEEVDHAGDGFFVAFTSGDAAIACAVEIQHVLAKHRGTHGFAPQIRIGLHAADAGRTEEGYKGKGVHETARVAALAKGGEILATRGTVPRSKTGFLLSEPRSVRLKGLSESVEVVVVDWLSQSSAG